LLYFFAQTYINQSALHRLTINSPASELAIMPDRWAMVAKAAVASRDMLRLVIEEEKLRAVLPVLPIVYIKVSGFVHIPQKIRSISEPWIKLDGITGSRVSPQVATFCFLYLCARYSNGRQVFTVLHSSPGTAFFLTVIYPCPP
jgi:hypothetical protein